LNDHSCIILVDADVQALDKRLAEIPEEWERVSIGKELSSFLMLADTTDRSRDIYIWLENHLREKAPGPVVCLDIDLLFEPSLKLDPLNIFLKVSRHVKLIIFWHGNYEDGVLSYAQPEHQHYKFWKNLEGIEIKGVHHAL
jgi:hypothetical protein